MTKVITYRGAYTSKQVSLCERHANDDSAGFSLGPVQHGEHDGDCDACEGEARCHCGKWSGGDACQWSGPKSETVVVEYMPDQHRESHKAAGNSGVFPHNGARRIRVSPECADLMIETDGDWCEIVP